MPGPDRTVETAVIPGQKLTGQTLFARYRTPNGKPGPAERSRTVTIECPSPAYAVAVNPGPNRQMVLQCLDGLPGR